MTTARRRMLCALSVPLLLALMAMMPSGATAAVKALASCIGPPSLECVPCPASASNCPDPDGQVGPAVPVGFTGAASTGDINSWAWDFNDGTQISRSNPGPVDHAFVAPGAHVVELKVSGSGGTDTTTMTVIVGARLKTRPSPPIALGAGALSMSASVDGRANPAPSATLDFRLYGPDDTTCARATAFQQLGVPYPVTGGFVGSSAFTPALAGTYRWSVSYAGDPSNNPAPLACGAAVVVSPPPPPATQQLPPGVTPSDVAPGVGTNPTCFGKRATIVATIDDELITGTPGPDVIVGGNSGEDINGRGGNDTICSRGGDDVVRGGTGNDRIYGGRGADLLLGGTGADILYGQSGKDRLGGQSGRDYVNAGSGNDLLDERRLGGGGKDRLIGGSGGDTIRAADESNDSVDCGSGRDTASLDRGDRQRLCDGVRRVASLRR